jgi:hypothetical protein
VHFSAYALPLPLISNFLVDQGESASCKCFPLLTFFCNFVNFDIVIFENDNFSTKVEFFWCARVHQAAYVSIKKVQTLILENQY